jgi:hypothetical protein
MGVRPSAVNDDQETACDERQHEQDERHYSSRSVARERKGFATRTGRVANFTRDCHGDRNLAANS